MSCDGSLFVFCFKDMLVNLSSVEFQAWKRCILWLMYVLTLQLLNPCLVSSVKFRGPHGPDRELDISKVQDTL